MTDSVGPDDQGGITIKFGPGHEAPWYTPRGTPKAIAAQVKEFFGLSEEDVADKSPSDIVALATHRIQHSWASLLVETGLGATLAESQPQRGGGFQRRPAGARPANPARGHDGGSSSAAEEDPHAGIKAEIEEADSEEALKGVYARNQKAFMDEQAKGAPFPLLDAWKARKATLTA